MTGTQGLFDTARRVANRDNLTLRDIGKWYAQGVLLPQFVGTAVAGGRPDRGVVHGGEADGFMVSAAQTPGTFNDFVDSVVPELQRRGLFRTEYTGATLRDHLGLVPRRSTAAQRHESRSAERGSQRGSQECAAQRIRSAAFSPISTHGAWVWPRMIVGHHRRVGDAQPVDATHAQVGSTTLPSSAPIRQVPTGWYSVCDNVFSADSSVSSVSSLDTAGPRDARRAPPASLATRRCRAVIRSPSINAARSSPASSDR